MQDLQLVSDYQTNPVYRASFNQLAIDIFGLSFTPWIERGGWNERYICYSLLDGDRIVSNVSINKMDVNWEGRHLKALQIGTVMTHVDYRKRGLASQLMRTILDEHLPNIDFIYLFSNVHAAEFYRHFNFTEYTETQFSSELTIAALNGEGVCKLETDNSSDWATIQRLIAERVPVSSVLGVINDRHLLMFYCLIVYPDDLYYLMEEDALAIFKHEGSTLHLYDIVSRHAVNLDSAIAKIAGPATSRAVFHFVPDSTNLPVTKELMPTDDVLFIQPTLTHISQDFMFPSTSHA